MLLNPERIWFGTVTSLNRTTLLPEEVAEAVVEHNFLEVPSEQPRNKWTCWTGHAPSQVMLDKAYAHTVQALEKKGLYIAPEKDQENPIWIPERLTRFIRHEDPDPDTSDKLDSSTDQSRTSNAVVGSDQNVADPDASAC
ncbi:hypothetical protein STEG23_029219 [Scotinomys teguina]